MEAPAKLSANGSFGRQDERPLIVRMYDPETKSQDEYGRTINDMRSWDDKQLERSHNYIQVLFPLPEGSMFSYRAPIINREVVEAFHSSAALRNSLRAAFERMLKFYGFAVMAESPEQKQREKEPGPGAEASKEVDKNEDPKTEGDIAQVTDTATGTKRKHDAVDSSAQQQTEAPQVETATDSNASVSGEPTPSLQPESTTSAAAAEPPSAEPPMGYSIIRGENWKQASRNWAVRMDHNHLRITRILRCLRVLGLQTECEAFYAALENVFNDPDIRINERSMEFWRRAVRQSLHVAPDGERVEWLKKWEKDEKASHATVEGGEDTKNEDATAKTHK